jgi:hypothetical protein
VSAEAIAECMPPAAGLRPDLALLGDQGKGTKVVTFSRRPEGSQTTPGPARWNSRREKIPTSGPASQGADDDCAADSAPVSLVQVRGSSGPYRPPVVVCLIVVFRCIGDK